MTTTIQKAEQLQDRRAHEEMMKKGTPIDVMVSTHTGKTSPGQVRLQVWDRKARAARAWRSLGICWGIALVCIFIPMLHFVLVPAFLAAGVFVAMNQYKQDRAILGGETTCPECGAFVPIARSTVKWPMRDLCSSCQRELFVEEKR